MNADKMFIGVAVPLPVNNIYTYAVPQDLVSFVQPGKRAVVPFGSRKVTGYILECQEAPDRNVDIRDILNIPDQHPLFPENLIRFFLWISDYYLYPIGEVIKTALPEGLSRVDYTSFAITAKGVEVLPSRNLSTAEKKILDVLAGGPCREKTLMDRLAGVAESSAAVRRLVKAELIIKSRILAPSETNEKRVRYIRCLKDDLPQDRFQEARKRILDRIDREKARPLSQLKKEIPEITGYLGYLEKNGFIAITRKFSFRDPLGDPIETDTPRIPTAEQESALKMLIASLDRGFAPFLLRGVTGSGKTEIYLQAAAKVIESGGNVLVLVPEIALISQIERRFRARFGEKVAVLHSRLTKRERFNQWMKIVSGGTPITIGARSAIFAPFVKTDLIIVDEEHDTSYKQETALRYNARDLAVIRARLDGGTVLLGSATPSIQSIYNVKIGKFREMTLSQRVEQRPLPAVEIVDLRTTRNLRGIRRFITDPLLLAMKETLSKNEQVLLFLNRRGYANFPVCHSCGESIKCINCDITLTLHASTNAYRCHYCGYSMAAVSSCRRCGSDKIKHLGMGTERLEKDIQSLFPDARIARMDRDTTRNRGTLVSILKGVKDGKTDILIGTQMVAKGHDFPKITLVGIVCADLSMNFPDFRAGERTFQLLAQVSGRAGRGDTPGRVILQTYNPDHYSIRCAQSQDVECFYQQEIPTRKALNYPPFSRIVQLRISGPKREDVERMARLTGEQCHEIQASIPSVEVLGPVEAPLSKIANQYRWQIFLKSPGSKTIHRFLNQYFAHTKNANRKGTVRIVADIDPFMML